MQNIDLKRGDTLGFTIELTDENDDPIDVETTAIRSQIRNSIQELIDEFTISKTGTGEYYFLVTDTTSLPITTLFFDIEVIYLGKIISSEDITLTVSEDRTYGEN